ncbi:MAG: hypothetical protein A2Y86_07900 [Candidatus Aminicenantes bacterium RBG_13_62_12]|jgi:hypothetical protein|nr:MAG: hypothetical protein A2Y86_07900 [Candidatus Aminicenantes bacterium RBG_13_62_12]
MQVSLLKNIVLVLLFLCLIWILRIVIKRELENLVRAALIFLLLGGVFYYLQTTESETLTFADISAQIKDKFFPEKAPDYVYHREESRAGRNNYVRYYFEIPGPKLSLDFDPKTQYFHIKDVYSVNRILEYLELPKVKVAVRELASLTGSRNDLTLYRWEDYPLGILTVERGICQDRDKLESYQCIVSIMIVRR